MYYAWYFDWKTGGCVGIVEKLGYNYNYRLMKINVFIIRFVFNVNLLTIMLIFFLHCIIYATPSFGLIMYLTYILVSIWIFFQGFVQYFLGLISFSAWSLFVTFQSSFLQNLTRMIIINFKLRYKLQSFRLNIKIIISYKKNIKSLVND